MSWATLDVGNGDIARAMANWNTVISSAYDGTCNGNIISLADVNSIRVRTMIGSYYVQIINSKMVA